MQLQPTTVDICDLAARAADALRPALPERDALQRVFREIRHAVRAYGCRRAILVGHNAAFDLAFLNAAVARAEVKRNPFHPFSCFDTATLAGAALGQTVLAKAVRVAGLEWDAGSAHNARYDAERSADLFCLVCNALRASHAAARRASDSRCAWHACHTNAISCFGERALSADGIGVHHRGITRLGLESFGHLADPAAQAGVRTGGVAAA